jgi:sugar/nucleoside kinase (ribokinase family)
VDVPVVDVTGAGDAAAAAAVHSLIGGLSPADTAALVTAAASVVVRSPDNTPAGLSEVLRSRN